MFIQKHNYLDVLTNTLIWTHLLFVIFFFPEHINTLTCLKLVSISFVNNHQLLRKSIASYSFYTNT